VIPPGEPDPCVPVRRHAADGAQLVACAHGGQVLGWVPAGPERRDRLWLSPLARCGPGASVRGGIPVIFPQFADRGPLPKHGLARNRPWELDTGSDGAPVARVAARLRDDASTREIWPHRFTLHLVAEAAGRELTLTLTVRNDAPAGESITDRDSFTFTAALHAYLAVNTSSARLVGVGGRPAEDNTVGGTVRTILAGALSGEGPTDLAIRGARGPVTLDDGIGGRLSLHSEGPDGFDSLVVWNPGDPHGLSDAPPGDDRHFLCVEPALLTPTTLAPQGVWRGRSRLAALVP